MPQAGIIFRMNESVEVDYAAGERRRDGGGAVGGSVNRGAEAASTSSTMQDTDETPAQDASEASARGYALNSNTRKLHRSDCPSVEDMSKKNKQETVLPHDEAIDRGYVPCGRCRP